MVAKRVMTFVASAVLARLVSADEFGVLAMAAVFIGLVDLFRDLGTGTVIVQKEKLPPDLLSSIFWLNAAFGVFAATVLFGLAEPIAGLYGQPRVAPVLRLLSAGFVLSGVSVVHASLLTRDMRFARLAAAETISAVCGTGAAIGLAYCGFGVWSLVWQSLVTTATTCGLLWTLSEWRPAPRFSVQVLRGILSYSANMTGFSFVNYFARNADNFIVGRYLGAQSLGYYNLAYRLFLSPLTLFSWVVMRVMLPVYAKLQTDHVAFCRAYTKASRAIAFVTFPIMFGLIAVADLLVVTVFGEAWRAAAPVVAVLAPIGALQSVGTTVGVIFQAKGRADVMLKWALFATPIIVGSFIAGLPWGIVGVAVAYAIVAALLQVAAFYVAFRLIDLRMTEFAKAILPAITCASGMVLAVLLVRYLVEGVFRGSVTLVLLIVSGAAVYSLLTWALNREGFVDVAAVLRRPSVEHVPTLSA